MAGDWIKIRIDLRDDIAFLGLAKTLTLSPDALIARIYDAAAWMQNQSKYGVMAGDPIILDVAIKTPGFAAAIHKAKWLAIRKNRYWFTTKFPCTPAYVRKGFGAKFRAEFIAGKRCAKCDSGELLEVDHVVAVADGGSHKRSNLQVLCRKCNRSKSRKRRSRK